MGGLGELQAAGLGAGQERVEEVVRERDVVVGDDDPVEGAQRRVARQQRVEVLELAQAGRGGREVERDVVARAGQLGARGGGIRLGTSVRSTPTTSTRRRGSRAAAARRRAAARRGGDVEQRVVRRAAARRACRRPGRWRPRGSRRRRAWRAGGGGTLSRSSSSDRIRPSECAVRIGPFAQRKRGPCSAQPASTRSSSRGVGARALEDVEAPRRAPAAVGGAGQRGAGARRRPRGGGPAPRRRRSGCARRRPSAAPATPARRRRARASRRTGRRAPARAAHGHVRAPRVRRRRGRPGRGRGA